MKFSERNRRRCEAPNGFNHKLDSWCLNKWMTALVGEVGEAANKIKKLNRIADGIPGNAPEETKEALTEAVSKELADAMIYLDLIAQAAGFDLETIRDQKFDETSRKIGYVEPAPAGEYKYGNAAGLEAKLLPGEPWFALRAKDALALETILHYAESADREGLFDHAKRVRLAADQISEWQNVNEDKVKLPS